MDFAYFKEHYKLIVIDLSKQPKLKGPQQINYGATMFSIIDKSEETTFNPVWPGLLGV